MIIEYSNAKESKIHAGVPAAIIIASCAFFFIPTTLIILGYLSSQPTGTLISPLPQGSLSEQLTPTPNTVTATPEIAQTQTTPLVAAPNDSTESADKNVTPIGNSNIIDKVASISAKLTEIPVSDADIKATSQVYLSPRLGDDAVYSVKSKTEGQMVIQVTQPSDTVRYVDYHIVNP